MPAWSQAGPVLSAFGASLVESVEALTVILAVGATRGWRGALAGAAGALLALAAILAIAGPALAKLPAALLHLLLGALLLTVGMRWLIKAIRREAGLIPLRDEQAAYQRHAGRLGALPAATSAWDGAALVTSFHITFLEGMEVVMIVLASGAGHLLVPASLAAATAALLVALAGAALHRPLTRVPENTLKFATAILLCAFGIFWAGEGAGLVWPGGDFCPIILIAAISLGSVIAVRRCRSIPGESHHGR